MGESFPQPVPKNEKAETPEELESFRRNLAPLFDERFFTLGHGTRPETAEKILGTGLESKDDNIASTAIALTNDMEGTRNILHWPHHNFKAVVVVSIPKSIPKNAELFEALSRTSTYDNNYVLPPKYIRGYVDVATRSFVPNPLFEEDPSYTMKELPAHPLLNDAAEANEPVVIPAPSEDSSSDIF
jgi:hypothetical protein